MHVLALIFGVALIGVVVWEMFESIVLPRRVDRRLRLTRFFFLGTWRPWRALISTLPSESWREELLALYGPASVLLLFAAWMFAMVVGFCFVFLSAGGPVRFSRGPEYGFWAHMYLSGSTFFTLGSADTVVLTGWMRATTVMEAGAGLGFLTVVIAYLPTLYSSFAKREVKISLLDSRAGSPATAGELLIRHSLYGDMSHLNRLLADWEIWSAELMETHIAYPVLCHFRSQHANQSWVAALCAILDTCALVMVGVEGVNPWQARLTFAMCRHALVDISQVFHRAPAPAPRDRLSAEAFEELCETLHQANVRVAGTPDSMARLKMLRDTYEPYAFALSGLLLTTLPPWTKSEWAKDNWTTSAWKTAHPASSL